MANVCKANYNTVDGTAVSTEQEIRAVISLGAGNTIHDIIRSDDTIVPDGIKLYAGTDVGYIPHGLVGNPSDLIIYAADGLLLSGLSVSYFDPTTSMWVGPIAPQLFLTNGSLNWGCWKNFAQVVIPFKSRITLLGAFVDAPGTGPDIDNDGVDDTLDPNSTNAVSNKVVTEALKSVADMHAEIKERQDAIIEGLQSGGVGYTMVEIDPSQLGQ